jgi:hypothetical protein
MYEEPEDVMLLSKIHMHKRNPIVAHMNDNFVRHQNVFDQYRM